MCAMRRGPAQPMRCVPACVRLRGAVVRGACEVMGCAVL